MNLKLLVAAVSAAPFLLVAGSVEASGGSGGGGGNPPQTSGPCVQIEALNVGIKVSGVEELKFKATSCSSSRQTLQTTIADSAYRTLYPNISCGDAQYAGPTLTLAPGDTIAFSINTRRGTCAIGASETHNVALTAWAPDGTALTTVYTSWYEASRAEGI
jgi:hypothetical protein